MNNNDAVNNELNQKKCNSHESCNCQKDSTCECRENDNEKECNCKKEKKEKKCNKDHKHIEELSKKVEEYVNLNTELVDKLTRTQAELINFKRRKEEETSLRLKYCNDSILLKLVEVADNFERAIKMDDTNLTDEVSKFLQGFKMIYAQLLEILKANEVVEIDCLGKVFDPKTSEAVIVEHYDEKESNVVVDVLQKGYMYKDRVLRAAMVKIND